MSHYFNLSIAKVTRCFIFSLPINSNESNIDGPAKLPVIAIIGNDASWQQIAREQKQMLGSNIGTELAFNAYEKVAEGYGGKGYYVDNQESLFETLKLAKEDAKLGYPVLVNVKLSKSDFRKGSISV